jgi:1-acyl-sn-glycerol-3-phosphate acyltransferase
VLTPVVILITVFFGPTSLVLTTDSPPELASLVSRDASGRMTRINLPDRLVIMANHQAYTDWMYLWILSCYAGHSRGITILLKASLKKLPVVGWGMVRSPPAVLTKYSPDSDVV